MRPLAIVSLLLVMLAGLALTPTASAAPAQPACNGIWAVTETIGPVTVFASPPCYEVSVDAVSCPVSPEEWREVRSGSIAVRIKTCGEVGSEASAAPPCTCPPPPYCRSPIAPTGPASGIVSVALTSDCRVLVEVLPIIACTDPLDGRKTVTLGRVSVTLPCGQIDACEPPLECYPASSSAVLIPPVCIRKDVTQGPVHANVGQCEPQQVDVDLCPDWGSAQGIDHAENIRDLIVLTLEACMPPAPAAAMVPPVCIEREVAVGTLAKAGFDQCRQSHETYPSCSSAQRIHRYEQVGVLYAQVDVCFPHSPPPALAASAIEPPVPPVCGPDMLCTAPECPPQSVGSNVDHQNSVTLNGDCSVDIVTGKGQICVGPWSGHDTIEVGPVTWDRYYCDFPGGPLDGIQVTASNPGPCGAAVDPTQRCPAPYPILPCRGMALASASPIAGPIVTYTISDSCHVDVYVKVDVMDCLWGEGYNKSFQQGPLTVWTWGCRPPYPPVE